MAGDWLKMRHDLADDPAVIRVAAECDLDDDAVLGKLFRLWSWVDRHTEDGNAEGVSVAWVDRYARASGFGAALVRAGWLVETGEGLSFPRFDRHCSDTAKARALKMERMRRSRGAARATESPPEKRRSEVPPPPREASQAGEAWQRLRAAWNAGATAEARRRPWKPADAPDGADAVIWADGWLDEALEAIPRLAGCKYFVSPVTLIQFTSPGFVQKVLGGQYDAPRTPKGGRAEPWQGDRPDPHATWSDADLKRLEATKRAMAAKVREVAT